LQQYGGVYFGAIGGLGALLAKRIKKSEVVAYGDLGAEAVYRLEVEDFPAVVLCDAHGGDLYSSAVKDWALEE
jgi:fumarate hydratase subunit beta